MLADVVEESDAVIGVLADADLAAFARIFEGHRRGALRLAYAMTGDAELAEDVVAEAFARTFRRWRQGAVHDPESYVRRAVVNEVRTTWRRLEVRRRHAARERRVEAHSSSGIDRIADADLLQRALATLPARVRAVVVLRVVEDLSEQQTAAALDCSVGTVKGYLSRGLERLRDAILSAEDDRDA
jgi:RNA polymerase sigma-70 factor (sigma-E family)